MPQGSIEIAGFVLSFFIILASFITGVVIYLRQYRKRKLEHEHEKLILIEKHQLQLMQTQLTSQQQTMQHIGREIHDSVGQKLTLASIYSNQLKETDPKKESIQKLIDESLKELRQLSKSLTDPSFTELSFIELLQKEAERINASGACYVFIEHNNNAAALQPGPKNILFRLLQEFMQNSLKHAACRNIRIAAAQNGNQLTVTATDDGKGFDKNNTTPGSGLYNMKRRAEELQATLHITSEPGKGTQLNITIPLNT
jgi:signal transduction histidine kinase